MQEAIEVRRNLAKVGPIKFNPELADSLQHLATMLSEFSHHAEVLEACQELVHICRELAQRDFQSRFVQSLDSLSVMFTNFIDLMRRRDQTKCRLNFTLTLHTSHNTCLIQMNELLVHVISCLNLLTVQLDRGLCYPCNRRELKSTGTIRSKFDAVCQSTSIGCSVAHTWRLL